jgi:hypothetical protein
VANAACVRKFVGRPLVPIEEGYVTPATGGEPPVPRAFRWDDETLRVTAVLRTWRSTKGDRGDTYLKRHWYELQTESGKKAEVYYDRASRRGASPWWLYTIDD